MTPRPDRWWKRTGIAAAVACGVCCAMPLITLLGGVGALSAIGAVFEKVSLVLAVVALGGAGVLWVRRRRRRACRVPERPVDLGMPEATRSRS
jgi:hypothetical protein